MKCSGIRTIFAVNCFASSINERYFKYNLLYKCSPSRFSRQVKQVDNLHLGELLEHDHGTCNAGSRWSGVLWGLVDDDWSAENIAQTVEFDQFVLVLFTHAIVVHVAIDLANLADLAVPAVIVVVATWGLEGVEVAASVGRCARVLGSHVQVGKLVNVPAVGARAESSQSALDCDLLINGYETV